MSKRKVLLVDDEEDFRKILGLRIKRWGYELIEASSGKEAIAVISQQVPDILILDYLMPGMDGVETLIELRKSQSKIPVIMLTAHLQEKVIVELKGLAVSAFIPKISEYTDTIRVLQTALKTIETRLDKEASNAEEKNTAR
jgi:CheY-like chemotaxis protein